MSWGGILAGALGGGANAVGDITKGMIDQDRRLESAKALSDIDEQKQLRIAEQRQRMVRADQTYNTTGQGAGELEAFAKRKAGLDLAAKEAEASSQTLRSAKVEDAKAEVTAKHDLTKKFTVEDAQDPAYIGAVTKLKLADPEVAQRIAASRAQVAESGARIGLIGAQTAGAKLSNDDKKQLGDMYDKASAILSDSAIDDAERAKQYQKIQQQIVLMKSKNGQVSGRDPELDTETITEKVIDPNTGAETTTTRKAVRKPGQTAPATAAPRGGPAVGTELNGFVFKGGSPNDQANWERSRSSNAPTRPDPISGQAMTESEWDRKYGKGDFKKLYKRGEDALTGF